MNKEQYTTGEVARALGVAPRTVAKWCDKDGYFPNAYRIAGTGKYKHRRIPRSDVISFVRSNFPESYLAKFE